MMNSFTFIEFFVYLLVWIVLGGIPGFYLFAALDRNPRVGTRLGGLAGAAVGFFGPLTSVLNSIEATLNAAIGLWIVLLAAALILPLLRVFQGNHHRVASWQTQVADLAYGLLLPTATIVIAIVIFPMLWNLILAFRPIRLRNLPELSLFSLEGFTVANFERVLTARGFTDTLVRTFVYTIIGTFGAILLGLIAAFVVRDSFPGRNLFRGFLLFPYVAPIISVVLMWKLIFNAQFGVFNEVVVALGGTRIDYLNTPGYAFVMVLLFQAWRYFPFCFLFLLARIQAIPDDMYEAARVDGATPSQRLWFITLPQLRTVFGTLFLLRFIWTFNKFEDVYLLTGGASGTKLITVEVYDQLFSARNVGTAAAVALVLAAVLFVVVGVYLRWFASEEPA
jgi:multiple sugar transport system permease protein